MLYHSAIMFFKKINRVSNFDKLEENSNQILAAKSIEELIAINTPLESEEAFMDEVKLGICFENYMKGTLLENGCLIHEINPQKNTSNYGELESLRKQQKGNPIRSSDFLLNESYDYDQHIKQNTLKSLSDRTINYSVMLNKGNYQNIIKTPLDIISILKKYNDQRNNLHFLISYGFSSGPQIIREWQTLISFVNNEMIKSYNTLTQELNPKSKRFIEEIV